MSWRRGSLVTITSWYTPIPFRWTKDRRVVLVMSNERKKWMTIRPLPTKKQVPLQFDVSMPFEWGFGLFSLTWY